MSKFLKFRRKPKFTHAELNGQIRDNSRFGSWVYMLAGATSVSSIVEIGTWKGLGSTALIAQAVKNKPQAIAISVEARKEFHEIAKKNLRDFPPISLLWGSLVQPAALDRLRLTQTEKNWFSEDLKNISASPNVTSAMPESIDFLLLDGGEFSSWAEFELLLPRLTGFLLLDDTQVRKNYKVQKFVSASDDWQLLDGGDDRNGWSVWMKI